MSSRRARRIQRGGSDESRRFSNPSLRQARRIRNRQLFAGEVLKLVPEAGQEGQHCTVLAPDGLIIVFPPERGDVEVWLAQPGTWVYRWGDGDKHQFEVAAQDAEVEQVDAEAPSKPLTPMIVTRRPRF
jgi:hypothetical protein